MQPSRRRRIVTGAAACLMMGVVLSFVSALPVLWVRDSRGVFNGDYADAQKYGVRMFLIPSDLERTEAQSRFDKPWWTFVAGMDGIRIGVDGEVAAGMPWPSLNGGTLVSINADDSFQILRHGFLREENGLMLNLDERIPFSSGGTGGIVGFGLDHIIPTRIIWRGLVGNTIFYGVIVWCVLALIGWCRRAIRRRRGRCEWCAYSLRGLENAERCPECGRGTRQKLASPRRGEDVITE